MIHRSGKGVGSNRARHFVRQLHLAMGLTLGALFALVGLTGSVLAFYPEIDAALHPQMAVTGSGGTPDWTRAYATVRQTYPDKPGPWRFEATGQPGPIPARYYAPPERAEYAFRPMMVWLSPDGSRVLRRDYWGEYAMTFLYDLHYRLLLEKPGGVVLGWTGLALIVLLLSGLWAWWPRGSWAKALRFKRLAPQQRRLRDWHKLGGLSGLVVLVVLTGTGVMLELPDESNAALNAVGLPVSGMHDVSVASGVTPTMIAPADAVKIAQAALPAARVAWIETPPASGGAYRLRMKVPGDPSRRFPHSFVWVDGSNGAVLAIHDARRVTSGDSVNNWVHPLHDGSAFGLAGRILVALGGLVPAMLFITGWRRWSIRRTGAKPARR